MFKYITGSRLYGYNDQVSDLDIKIIQKDKLPAVRQRENGLKTDIIYWSFDELTSGVKNGNPYLIETLFVPKSYVIEGSLDLDLNIDIDACKRGYKAAILSKLSDVDFLIHCENCQASKIVKSFATEAYRMYYDLLDIIQNNKIFYPKTNEQIEQLTKIKRQRCTGGQLKIEAYLLKENTLKTCI